MNCLYIVILTAYSFRLLKEGLSSKILIVTYMAVSTILTAFLELTNTVNNLTEEIAAFDIIIYYIYLAAIQYSDTQALLHRNELELEKSKLTLLISQIKPHFINNALLSIREYCYEEPEKAAELIDHFAVYLRNNVNSADSDTLIPFSEEIATVREYLTLEYADHTKQFIVEYNLEVTNFKVPPLSIKKKKKNAVKHGIDRYSPNSIVNLHSFEDEHSHIIEIRDNGKGFDMNEETLGKGGIGFKNARTRLELMCGGSLDITRENGWTIVLIKIVKE